MTTRGFLEQLARMQTVEEMGGEMASDDAVEALNFAIRKARELLGAADVRDRHPSSNERALFECFAKTQSFDIDRNPDDEDYSSVPTRIAWNAWRARATMPSVGMNSEQLVLVVGNPVDGFEFHGPFYFADNASRWAEDTIQNVDWVIGPLLLPTGPMAPNAQEASEDPFD